MAHLSIDFVAFLLNIRRRNLFFEAYVVYSIVTVGLYYENARERCGRERMDKFEVN